MVSFEKAPVNELTTSQQLRSHETIIKIWSTTSSNIFKNNLSIFVQTNENHDDMFLYMYVRGDIPINLTDYVGKTVFVVFTSIRRELQKRIKFEALLEAKLSGTGSTRKKKRQRRRS